MEIELISNNVTFKYVEFPHNAEEFASTSLFDINNEFASWSLNNS